MARQHYTAFSFRLRQMETAGVGNSNTLLLTQIIEDPHVSTDGKLPQYLEAENETCRDQLGQLVDGFRIKRSLQRERETLFLIRDDEWYNMIESNTFLLTGNKTITDPSRSENFIKMIANMLLLVFS
jgi:hypothetical protein